MSRECYDGEFIVRLTVGTNNETDRVVVCDNIEVYYDCNQVIWTSDTNHKYYALVLGIPVEASSEEVLKLFEPIQNEEVQFLLLSSTNYHHNMQQVQLFSLFVFSSPSTRNMFTTLYHNLPLTQYPECPPLLVIAVDHVSWSAQQPDQMPISLTSLCNCQCQEDGKLKFQLSNCSICNRRIKVISSRFLMGRSLATTNFDGEDIAVGKSFHYLPDIKVHSDWSQRVTSSVPTTRCIVCAIFHDVQTRDSSTTGSSTKEPVQTCSICNVRENNWICLMCGYIGCGRYTAQHAHQHFDTTRHRFSLELVSGRLWDYIQDTFVNFENNSSVYGGMMQSAHTCGAGHSSDWTHPNVNPPHTKLLMGQSSEMPPNQLDHDLQSKLNQSINEYERLVEWQLQDQQLFYEKMIARETVRAMEYSFRDDHLSDKDKKGDEAKDFNEGMEEIEAMKYEITVLESEYRELHDQLRFLDDENKKYKKMNDDVAHEHKCLKEEELHWVAKEGDMALQASQHMKELEQQIRDLTFYVNTKKKLDSSPIKQELAGGSLVTTVSPDPPIPAKRKPKITKSRYSKN